MEKIRLIESIFLVLIHLEISLQRDVMLEDFHGLSPHDMHGILYDFLGESCMIQLKSPSEDLFKASPVYNLFDYCIRALEKGPIALTSAGY